MADTMVPSPVKSELNSRKNKKPLMEKRRRARINSCLTQLKSLVLQAIRKDSSQFSKLEKADILELTVKHLRGIQRQQAAGVMAQDPLVVSKYRAGFNECAKEVVRYMSSVREVNDDVKDRVMSHLAGCVHVVNHVSPMESLQHQHQHHHHHQQLSQQQQQQQQQQQLKSLHVAIPSHPVVAQQPQPQPQPQPISAAALAPSVLLPSLAVAPAPASLHSAALAFNNVSPPPPSSIPHPHPHSHSHQHPPPPPPSSSSSSPSSSPRSASSSPKDCSPHSLPPSSSPVSTAAGLAALALQASSSSSGSVTAPQTQTTVLARTSHHHHHHPAPIAGAFKIVPSSVAAGGAVAVFLGNSNNSNNNNISSSNGLDAGLMSRSDTSISVDALPLYSVALPQNAVTAYVTPPANTSHMMASLSPSASSDSSRLSIVTASPSPPPHPAVSKADYSQLQTLATVAAGVTAPSSLPVDLRQSHKMKSGLDSSSKSYPALPFVNCGMVPSPSDDKLWRPW